MAESVSSSGSLPPLRGFAYAEAFRHFMRSLIRPQEGPSLTYLKRSLPSLCLPPSADRHGPVRILSIGAGIGDDDFWLIKNVFLPHSQNLHYDAIEPNPDHFETLKKRAQDANICGLHVHNVAFEEFPPPPKVEDRYDIVLLIHSLYYLSPKTLPLILAEYLPADSGSIVILLDSPAGLPALQRGLGVPGPHDLHLDDVLEGLDAAKKEIVYTTQWMDVEEAFENTPAAVHLLGFIVNRDLTQAAPQVVNSIRKDLQAKLLIRNGRRTYWLPEGVGIVQKKEFSRNSPVTENAALISS